MTKSILEQLKETYKGEVESTVLDYMFKWDFGQGQWFILIEDTGWVWTMDDKFNILRDNWKVSQ